MRNQITTDSEQAILQGSDGEVVILQKVEIEGRADDLLFKIKLRQHYRNDTKKTIETVYTFPLAWGATLLGVSAHIAGKTWQGVVIEKSESEQRYEKAIEEGDTPIMVEKSGHGLYTAHLGNLKKGEEAIIEIEYAQLLKFDQGAVRLSIPTTVAPRFGDPVKTGKLKKPASVDVDLSANYPFTLHLQCGGALAKGQISSPSHTVVTSMGDNSIQVKLDRLGHLDRDIVLNLQGLENTIFNSVVKDDDQYVMLSSFTPTLPVVNEKDQTSQAIDLKILVDCSGSMQGMSIAQACEGLRQLARQLTEHDRASYTRFGSQTTHVIRTLHACTPEFVGNHLKAAIDNTDADMGGTEMHEALNKTFKISSKLLEERNGNVLLITDGEVWDIDKIIASANLSNHRVFAIGVGTAPADSLLQELAEQTGGACELVSPNEDMAGAIARMVSKMRTFTPTGLQVEWPCATTWASPPPKSLFPGETVHLFAIIATKPTHGPTVRFGESSAVQEANVAINELSENNSTDNTLARLAAARRMRTITDDKAATELALLYQLVTENTNLFMVVERAADDKAEGLPESHNIKHMLARGWGNVMPIVADFSMQAIMPSSSRLLLKPMAHKMRSSSSQSQFMSLSAYDKPKYMRKQADVVSQSVNASGILGCSPSELIDVLDDIAFGHSLFEDALIHLLNSNLPAEVKQAVNTIESTTGDPVSAWAIFFDWLSFTLTADKPLSRHAMRLLRDGVKDLPYEISEGMFAMLTEVFPTIDRDDWGTFEADKLQEQFNAAIINRLHPI
ncbi:marine_srt_targ, marine proteobacterial sortase target protein [Oxalobacteraceae bacterium]